MKEREKNRLLPASEREGAQSDQSKPDQSKLDPVH
jgi:hypothetical protein